jgi:hypothetical protein
MKLNEQFGEQKIRTIFCRAGSFAGGEKTAGALTALGCIKGTALPLPAFLPRRSYIR